MPRLNELYSTFLQADSNNNAIRLLRLSNGVVSTLIGMSEQSGFSDGAGTVALLSWPVGVAMNAAGTIAVVVSQVDGTLCKT